MLRQRIFESFNWPKLDLGESDCIWPTYCYRIQIVPLFAAKVPHSCSESYTENGCSIP